MGSAQNNLIPAIGDTVRLISGGPPMTVERLESAQVAGPLAPGASAPILVHCIWFNQAHALARGPFDARTLVEADDGDDTEDTPPSSTPPTPPPPTGSSFSGT